MTRLETKVPPVIWWALCVGLAALIAQTIGDDVLDATWARVVGVVSALLGLAIAVTAVAGFGRAKTTVDPHGIDKASSLVTSGIYRITRNPMYLGLLLILIGLCFRLGSAAGLVVAAVAFWALINRFQIGPEERMLRDKFGEEYSDFVTSVRRWI